MKFWIAKDFNKIKEYHAVAMHLVSLWFCWFVDSSLVVYVAVLDVAVLA
jgi:hypothetical protein